MIVNNVHESRNFDGEIDNITEHHTASLCVPLTNKGADCEVVGAIQLNANREFSVGDLIFLENIAAQITVSIKNIQKHDNSMAKLEESIKSAKLLDMRLEKASENYQNLRSGSTKTGKSYSNDKSFDYQFRSRPPISRFVAHGSKHGSCR